MTSNDRLSLSVSRKQLRITAWGRGVFVIGTVLVALVAVVWSLLRS